MVDVDFVLLRYIFEVILVIVVNLLLGQQEHSPPPEFLGFVLLTILVCSNPLSMHPL